MKRHALLIVLISFFLTSSAQVKILDSLHWNIGTSFATSSGYGSAITSWISPSLSYKVGKKFQVFGGVSLVNTTFIGIRPWTFENSISGWSGNLTDLVIYGGGRYAITPRLQLTGSAWKRIPLLQEPFPGNSSNSLYPSSRNQGLDIYLDYRIGKNVTIGAGFRYSQGSGAGFNDPFTPDPFRNSSSFSPAFGW